MNQANQAALVEKGNVRIYACGGAGINIGSLFEEFRGFDDKGVAVAQPAYLDTSRSNLKPSLKDEDIFILSDVLDGVDGSGKDRSANAAGIQRHMPAILQKLQPGYVNVVICSASGGSGSVIAPVLVNNLLKEGKMVIVLCIGVAKTGKEISNTLATMQSFERVATATGKPVVMAYFENNKETPPSKVDEAATELITAISVLFSRENTGLDTMDMYKFLNFNDKVTSYPAHLAGLTMAHGELVAEGNENVISVATAAVNDDNVGVEFVVPYGCYGLLPAGVSQDVVGRAPLHLLTHAYAFNDLAKRLTDVKQGLERAAQSRVDESALKTGPVEGDDILVLD